RERQPHIHAAGVALDGGVDEFLQLREGDDLVELARDLSLLHAQNGAIEIDVLAAGEFRMEAGADLEQGTNAAVDVSRTARRPGDAGEDFEQRALPCSVAPDNAED